jgi:hypothetical protein
MYDCFQYESVFVPGKLFQPSVMIVGKVGAYLICLGTFQVLHS